MTDSEHEHGAKLMLILAILAGILIAAAAIGFVWYRQKQSDSREDWKKRWNEETKALEEDLRLQSKQIDQRQNEIDVHEQKTKALLEELRKASEAHPQPEPGK